MTIFRKLGMSEKCEICKKSAAVFCITSTSQPFRVTLIGSRVIEECQVKMISSSSLFFLLLAISVQFAASLPTNSDEYEYPNDAEGDEYEYEDERSDEKFVAKELDVKITSEKKHVVVGEEDVIRLQCLVENNGQSISIFYLGDLPFYYSLIHVTGSGDNIRFPVGSLLNCTPYHFLSSC